MVMRVSVDTILRSECMPKVYSKSCPCCESPFQDRKSLYNHKIARHTEELAESRIDKKRRIEEKRLRREREMTSKAKDALALDKINDACKLIDHCVEEKKNNREIDFSLLPALRCNVRKFLSCSFFPCFFPSYSLLHTTKHNREGTKLTL